MPDGAVSLAALRAGGKRALAEALSGLEAGLEAPGNAALLDAALSEPKGFSLGLTGPPGVGKSTLTDALIRSWRAEGRTIGVIAVDPSSTRSRGALLGDRTRLTTDPADPGVFVRSMAARSELGGVAGITLPAVVLMRALYDLVLVETVGVGQSETAVADVTDLTAFCAQPGSGDALQYMKAGIMEVPDLILVTKADMGAVAACTAADLKGALSLTEGGRVPVQSVSALTGEGLEAAVVAISDLGARLSPNLAETRSRRVIRWGARQIEGRFGTEGLHLVHKRDVDKSSGFPFRKIQTQMTWLKEAFSEAFG